jgi:hypothetical protein
LKLGRLDEADKEFDKALSLKGSLWKPSMARLRSLWPGTSWMRPRVPLQGLPAKTMREGGLLPHGTDSSSFSRTTWRKRRRGTAGLLMNPNDRTTGLVADI